MNIIKRLHRGGIAAAAAGLFLVAAPAATPASITVTLENLAPANGNFMTPLWVGFHNGLFDLYNQGEAASMGLERLAEDGTTMALMNEFNAGGAGMIRERYLVQWYRRARPDQAR